MGRSLTRAAILAPVLAPALALAAAVSFVAMNAPAFLGFAIHADTLYPALLVEDARHDPAALLRFQPSRVPSFVPDLAVAGLIDAVTGRWRLAFWGYAAFAFAALGLLGGWIARRVFGPRAGAAGAWLALLLAGLVLVALGQQAHVAALGRGMADPPPLPANLHVMLMMPVWQSGAFIAGLAVLCLTWQAARRGGWPVLAGLGLATTLASASNTIVVAHAVLPGLIALADAAWRRAVAPRAALRIAAVLGLGVAAGFGLGLASGRAPLPAGTGLLDQLRAMPGDLWREPAQLLMLLSCLPIGLAFLRPGWAAARLPPGGDAGALRFFVVAASAACAAAVALTALLYHGPHAWRYGNPTAWWPAIFLAGLLALRWRRGVAGLAVAAAGAIVLAAAAAGGAASPALLRWRPPELACLDAADPGVTLKAGLAAYWHARTLAAASGWRRQVESTDFGDARPFLWIEDSRSVVQARGAPRGTPPPYRFILMTGLDPAAIERIHGRPERVLPCGATAFWIYPEGWDPVDRLVALADPLVPEALAIGRAVCTGAERLLPAGEATPGRALTLPPGRWRIALHHGGAAAGDRAQRAAGDRSQRAGGDQSQRAGGAGARWRILAEPGGAVLAELPLDAAAAAVELGDPSARTRIRLLVQPGEGPMPALHGLSLTAAGAAPAACPVPPVPLSRP